MADILIYKDRADLKGDSDNISLLKRRFDSTEFCSKSLESLKEHISDEKVQVLILLVGERVSQDLERFLDKCKNHINLHDALLVFVHTKLTAQDAQVSLMLGAGFLLEEPLDINFLTSVIKHQVLKEAFDLTGIGYVQLKSPTECLVDSFGRIGRFDKRVPGKIFVETSIDWEVGSKVELHNSIAQDLKQPTLSYLVKGKNSKGLYFRYAYQYVLEWQSPGINTDTFRDWLESRHSEMSAPKVKVLFLVNNLKSVAPIELDTELFSNYLLPSTQVGRQLLERIDPQIIIKEPLSKLHEDEVKDWLTNQVTEKLLIEERSLAVEDLQEKKLQRDRVLKEIVPFARNNAISTFEQFYYLNRRSRYSRFASSCKAEMIAISPHHILLLSDVSFAQGATLQVFLPADPTAIYLRVLRSDKSARGGKWEVNCSIFYLSEKQREAISGVKVEIDSKKSKISASHKYLSAEKRIDFLSGKRRATRVVVAIALIIIVALALGLFLFKQTTSEAPVTLEPDSGGFEDSIEKLQKSVKKAFGEEKNK